MVGRWEESGVLTRVVGGSCWIFIIVGGGYIGGLGGKSDGCCFFGKFGH